MMEIKGRIQNLENEPLSGILVSAYDRWDVGEVISTGCLKQYPLSTQYDLKFRDLHPMFGIRACSNVFSDASNDLEGIIFEPTLARLTDKVLEEWYFEHSSNEDDMPFGRDISNPFSFPYIKYHSAKS